MMTISFIQEESDLTLDDVVYTQYEPQVLSAASSNTMMHFFPHPRQDLDYPGLKPEINPKDKFISRRTAAKSFESLGHSRFSKAIYTSKNSGVSPMSVTRHMSVRGTKMKKNKMTTIPEFPVSEEVIKSITTFCYPGTLVKSELKLEICEIQFQFIKKQLEKGNNYVKEMITLLRTCIYTVKTKKTKTGKAVDYSS